MGLKDLDEDRSVESESNKERMRNELGKKYSLVTTLVISISF